MIATCLSLFLSRSFVPCFFLLRFGSPRWYSPLCLCLRLRTVFDTPKKRRRHFDLRESDTHFAFFHLLTLLTSAQLWSFDFEFSLLAAVCEDSLHLEII